MVIYVQRLPEPIGWQTQRINLRFPRPKNSSLQNKPFKLKCSEEQKFVGFAYGSLSENEVAVSADWDAYSILNRSLRLLEFAESRWGLELHDKAKQISVLGLDFVVKVR